MPVSAGPHGSGGQQPGGVQEFAEGPGEVGQPVGRLAFPGGAQAPYDPQGGRLGARESREAGGVGGTQQFGLDDGAARRDPRGEGFGGGPPERRRGAQLGTGEGFRLGLGGRFGG